MENRHAGVVEKQLEVLFREGTVTGLDDAQLLERFAAHRDEAAFAALLARHGPMVLAACRGLLRDVHKADDVFQATFLVLARRAGAIRHPDRLGAWLYGVACHAAARAKRSESRRLRREREAAMSTTHAGRLADQTLEHEAAEALLEEIGRLPERYRTPVVLCDLQGLARTEAARRLGSPLGTVNGRLSRARDLLRRRLARRGIALSAGALASGAAATAVPDALAMETVGAAVNFASGMATAAVAAPGGLLAREVLRAMMLTKSVSVALGIGIVSLGLLGSVLFVRQDAELRSRQEAEARAEAPRSALDSLRATDIPADEQLSGQPMNLVSVLGEHRGRHGGDVRCLAISPDGKTLATGSTQDKDIKLWDAQTLLLRARLIGHRSPVNCLAISPDGKTLVSGSAFGDFLIWDLSGDVPKGPASLETRGPSGWNNLIHAVAFSPDGKTLAVSGSGKGVALFDCAGLAPRERTLLPGLGEEVRSLTFATNGTTLALAVVGDGSVRLWDLGGDAPRERASLPSAAPPGRRTYGPFSVAIAPNGKTLAVIEFDPHECIRLWDLTDPRPIATGQLGIGLKGVKFLHAQMVTFTPDGNSLLAGQGDGSVRTWDLTASGPVERATFAAHVGPVDVLAFTPDGKTLVTGGDDHLVRTWDATAAIPREKVVPKGAVGGLKAIAFAPDGQTLAVGGDDHVVRIWDLAETRPSGQAPAPKAEITTRGPVQSLAFSPDGKTLACGDEVWDGFALRRVLGQGDTWSLAYTPDGKTLIAGSEGQKVRLWDMGGNGPRLRLTLSGDPANPPGNLNIARPVGPPSVVAISPDGKFLAFTVEGKSARLWELFGDAPRECAKLEGTGWRISSLAFALDGKTLAAGTNGGTLLWDLSHDAPQVLRTIKECLAFSMAFSRGGSRLIAADEVMTSGKPLDPSRPAVCVYEVATGKRLHAWDLSAPCWAIALAPDGRHVAAAKQDGTVDILRLTPGR